jgi:hypothetical protein
MENKIPTAEEFIKNFNREEGHNFEQDVPKAMQEFAKLHVEAALNEVTEKLYFRDSNGHVIRSEESNKLVLKVYPLTNIK